MDVLQEAFGDGNVSPDELLVHLLVSRLDFAVGCFLLRLNIVDLLEELAFSPLSNVVSDVAVVQILQVLQCANCEHLVVSVLLALLAEGILLQVQHLEVVVQASEVLAGVVQVADAVLAKRKYVELLKSIESLDDLNLVGVERQVGQVGELVEALDLGDEVERQVEPLELSQVVQVLDLADDVVVQLKLSQLVHTVQVLDSYDVLVAQGQGLQLPQRNVVLVEDEVLSVVLENKLSDQVIVYDGGLHRLLLALDLRLHLEVLRSLLVESFAFSLHHQFKFKL